MRHADWNCLDSTCETVCCSAKFASFINSLHGMGSALAWGGGLRFHLLLFAWLNLANVAISDAFRGAPLRCLAWVHCEALQRNQGIDVALAKNAGAGQIPD